MIRPITEPGGGPFRVNPLCPLLLGLDVDEKLLGVDLPGEGLGSLPAVVNRACRALSVVVMAATLSACGDPASNDIVVAGDDCSYAGPTTLDAGPVTVALHLTNLGHNELILAALEGGHSYSDVEAYLELDRSSTNAAKGSHRATLQTLDSTRLYPSASCPLKVRGEATNATASPKTGCQTAGEDSLRVFALCSVRTFMLRWSRREEPIVSTAYEQYRARRLTNPEFKALYEQKRAEIDAIDTILSHIEERREELGLSKADLARLVGARPESVRRLLSTRSSNPTLFTVMRLASALGMEIDIKATVSAQELGPEVRKAAKDLTAATA